MDTPNSNTSNPNPSNLTAPDLTLTRTHTPASSENPVLTTLPLTLTDTIITPTLFPVTSISTPSLDLTPDEKRSLLFDAVSPFEVPEEEFDKNWWPLVSNIWTVYNSRKHINGDSCKIFICRFNKHRDSSERKNQEDSTKKRRMTMVRPPGLCYAKIKVLWLVSTKMVRIENVKDSPKHSHPLKESDRLKRSEVIRTLVEEEAVKSYPPVAIVDAVKEHANTLSLGSSVQDLKRREVANIKYKVRGPMETHLVGSTKLEQDISDAMSYLNDQEYHTERYRISLSQKSTQGVSQRSTQGIAFAHPKQLDKLRRYGWLTLMDSTHKTNKHDWRLFTLYIRDGYGCWDVGAHFFVSNEDSETIAEGLRIIRNKCPRWSPRYFLLDQSSAEANSIKQVFPGLRGGEQECEIILCTVHIMRTWISKIYEKKTRETMVLAMHKTTRIGCDQLLQEAINTCPVSAIKNYIKRNYTDNVRQWALWARQHSPLLLQTTSTNALESYHSELKRTTSHLYGLIGKP